MLDYLSISLLFIVLVSLAAAVVAVRLPLMVDAYRMGRIKDRFSCLCCGNCCRFKVIHMDEGDVERIGKAGHKDFYRKVDGETILRRVNGKCVFQRDDKCSIHEIKPEVCRNFPFYKMYGVWWCNRASMCPAVEKLGELV